MKISTPVHPFHLQKWYHKLFSQLCERPFFRIFSFGSDNSFFIEDECIKWLNICSIFISSWKIIEKILHRFYAVLSENVDIARSGFKRMLFTVYSRNLKLFSQLLNAPVYNVQIALKSKIRFLRGRGICFECWTSGVLR